MPPRYEAWEDGEGVMCGTAEGCADARRRALVGPDARLLYSFEAGTPEEAMAIHHLRMGWEPYRPIGEAAACPRCGAMRYPEGSGECWRCGPADRVDPTS